MFFIKLAFWLGLVVLLLPADERQQAQLYGSAVAAVERVTTFCDRNEKVCTTGAELWATMMRKAEFGARMASGLVSRRLAPRDDESAPALMQPASARSKAEPRMAPGMSGTLTPTDLSPPWRGQGQRSRT